jgi:hypothetical protein
VHFFDYCDLTFRPVLTFRMTPSIFVPLSPAVPAAFSLLENVGALPPRQGTNVSVSRTETHLNIRFDCEDDRPWATITRRDGPLYQEEVVEVFIDPFGDMECYFEIEVNPLNAVMDLMLRRVIRGWRKDFSWNCEGLETAVEMHGTGWSASLAIPFASLSAAPGPGTKWRANFLRIDRPAAGPRELSAWSPTRLNTFHHPPAFGTLIF